MAGDSASRFHQIVMEMFHALQGILKKAASVSLIQHLTMRWSVYFRVWMARNWPRSRRSSESDDQRPSHTGAYDARKPSPPVVLVTCPSVTRLHMPNHLTFQAPWELWTSLEKGRLTISIGDKSKKTVELKVTGTSKFHLMSPQVRAGKTVITQRSAETSDLTPGQSIAVIYTVVNKENVVLTVSTTPIKASTSSTPTFPVNGRPGGWAGPPCGRPSGCCFTRCSRPCARSG